MKYIIPIILLLLISPINYAKLPCDGCDFNNLCLEIGTQRLTQENGYEIYCSINKKIERAKDDNEPCNNHYECKSYYCNQVCSSLIPKQREKIKNFTLMLSITLIIAAIITLAFLVKLKVIKIKLPERKIQHKKEISVQKPPFMRTSPKPTKKFQRFDELEKQLQQSIKIRK